MPTLNADTVYDLPSREIQKGGIEINDAELAALITAVQPHLDETVRDEFAKRMDIHVGKYSTYSLKKEVLEGLKIIHAHFFKPNISSSEQSAIAFKLAERAAHCTPGFHNGVNAIVDGFYLPKNTNDLLCRYRRELVATAANQLSDEVHTHNRCFTVAASMRYGVHPLNSGDIYQGKFPDYRIKSTLCTVFDENMRLLPMLQGLKSQMLSLLLNAGYQGESTDFSPEVIEKIDPLFMTLFSHHPIVESLKTAQAAHKRQEEVYSRAHEEALNNMRDFVLQHPLEFSGFDIHQRAKLDYLLTGRGLPTFKKWGDDCLAKLSDADRDTFERIKSNIPTMNASIKEKWLLANQKFNQYFYTHDENGHILDVNWKKIDQLMWQSIQENKYFTFEENEQQAFNDLFKPDISEADFKQACVRVFKTSESFDDLLGMLELFPKMKKLLDINELMEYLNKTQMTYEQFKKTISKLGDSDLGKAFVRRYYELFLPNLREDPLMPISLFPLMEDDVIEQFFSGNCDKNTMQHLLSGLMTCSDAVKTRVLMPPNRDGYNKLMTANALMEPLLQLVDTLPDNVKNRLLTQTDKNGENALMHAVTRNIKIEPLLKLLDACPPDIKAQVLTQQRQPGRFNGSNETALIRAVFSNPAALEPLLKSLDTCSDAVKYQVFSEMYNVGSTANTALMIAILEGRHMCATTLLTALSRYDPWVQARVLTKTNEQGKDVFKMAQEKGLDLSQFSLQYNDTNIALARMEHNMPGLLSNIQKTTNSAQWQAVMDTFGEYQRTQDPSLLETAYKNAHVLLKDPNIKKYFDTHNPKTISERLKILKKRPSGYEKMVQEVMNAMRQLNPQLQEIDLSMEANGFKYG